MLYSLYEAQHALLGPWRHAAELARGWYAHPFSPFSYTPMGRRMAASSDLFLRVTQRYEKPRWDIASVRIGERELPVHVEIAEAKPFCNLLHFRRELDAPRQDPKVLLVAPLSGHHATLLRDTVRTLLPSHEVWVTDWLDARMVPLSEGAFHLATYVDYIREFIGKLAPDINVISVCQPTVPVLAAVSLMAEHGETAPRTMVMMGGPIDARRSPTAVNNLAMQKPYSWFERHVIHRVPSKYPGYMRKVYPGFLQHMGFVAMNPSRHMDAHWDYFGHLLQGDDDSAEKHREFYDEYNAVLDMPAEYYLDTIKTVFQDFALPKGRMFVRDELVRPQAIHKTALLTIEGELDDISGNGQTEAAHQLCLNIPRERREHYVAPGAGHYGIFSGRRWRQTICPRVVDFIRRHA
ncbi:MAG: polyhydroxyalkanoate depolymerase [Proteobacteria bacterium]|nr:polyhydroxyalkanoate depolymerase [Pseudomonadota bacterium]MDA0983219.1 polyhydroxyalkanoate depolymerase [Pseudomonadota bacterium]